MALHPSAPLAISAMKLELVGALIAATRVLLQEKHLYQSVSIDVQSIVKAHKTLERDTSLYVHAVGSAPSWAWWATDAEERGPRASSTANPTIVWRAPDIKTHCHICKRIEAFNLVSASNFLNQDEPLGRGIHGEQVFVLSYMCQSCKRIPQVFLIRKMTNRLILCGRSPMEFVEVPKAIPEETAKYFSGALLAYQSGQVLPALFMLRTLCEQWSRLFAAADSYADTAIDAYMATLPEDFKGRFPSIRTLYGELSAAMHAANEDTSLFERSVAQITEHFEARRLFKIQGPMQRAS